MWARIEKSIKEHPIRWVVVAFRRVVGVFWWVAGVFFTGRAFIFWGVVVFIAGFVVIFSYYEWFACLLKIKFFENNTGAKDRIEFVSRLALLWTGLLGIVLATWRNIVSQSQLDVAHRSQVSDQWTRAMDLLTRIDSKNKPLMEARIGGLNSLEFLANADPEGYGVHIMKSIVSYIKANAQKTAEHGLNKLMLFPLGMDKKTLGEDVQMAFRLLWNVYNSDKMQALRRQGKLKRFFDKGQYGDDLDFSGADFRRLDFREVQWIERPCLQGVRLQSANLFKANLQGANLWQAELQGAVLPMAYLQGANLWGVNLQGANLFGTYLQGANLFMAYLQGANLVWAQLQGADLNTTRLDFSVWHKAQFDTSREKLENLPSEDEVFLSQDKMMDVLKNFDKKGNKRLWQPKSAQIFCDRDFEPLAYGHEPTQCLDPNDNNIEWWQEGWEAILRSVKSSYPDVICGFIDTHGCIGHEEENYCAQGLRLAIQDLDDYETIKKELPKRHQDWLKPPKKS